MASVSRSGTSPGPDFLSGAAEHRRRTTGRRRPLGRALGLRGDIAPEVVDTNAGLGMDAFEMACLGCRVTLLERVPALAQALEQALATARSRTDPGHPVHRMTVIQADAKAWLRVATEPPWTVYLDPMYPERRKSALGQGELQRLRALAGDDPDAPELLEIALATAGRRVVVKRPLRAPRLAGPPPTLVIRGRTTRFDVYLLDQGLLQPPC